MGQQAGKFKGRVRTVAMIQVLGCLLLYSAGAAHAEERQCVQKVLPAYPELARKMHIIGTIRVTATVDASGAVVKAESDSANKMLAPAAVDAVKRWKFSPGAGNDLVSVQVNFDTGA